MLTTINFLGKVYRSRVICAGIELLLFALECRLVRPRDRMSRDTIREIIRFFADPVNTIKFHADTRDAVVMYAVSTTVSSVRTP